MPKRKNSEEEKKVKKSKIHKENAPNSEVVNVTKQKKSNEDSIPWSDSDLLELISNIESNIPEDDNLSYGCRMEKLDWNDVIFKDHSVNECQQVWSVLLKQMRKYRLLKEITGDMKSWIQSPKTSATRENIFKHPDKPKQPPNSYMLFVEEKRCEVVGQYPDLAPTDISRKLGEMFKNLPMNEKEKYNRRAKVARQEYTEKLENFYLDHPNLIPKRHKQSKQLHQQGTGGPPEKPKTPFQLYVQVESEKADPEEAKHVLHKKFRESWNAMNDKSKFFWINWAEEQYTTYVENLKDYIKSHPQYEPEKIKSVLSKEEKKIKDRISGKPDKPPHTAYHLFMKMIMESDEIRKINYKEAVNYISEKWKSFPEEERNEYKIRVEQMWQEYHRKLEEHMMSLPAEERE